MKESFIFYRSFYEAIEDLPDEEQLKIYKAIFKLALNDEEVNLDGISNTIFKLIKPQLKANNDRYENGKKGGRPKKEPEVLNENEENKNTKKPWVSKLELPD